MANKTTSKSSSKKGVSKGLIIGIAATILLAGGAGLYFVSQQAGVNIPLVKAPLNASCEHNDPDLCKFLNNWESIKDYSITSTTLSEGKKIESLMELSGDDKFHMMSSTDGTEEYNMISIGDTTYTKDISDGKWWKMTSKPEDNKTLTEMKDEFDYGNSEETEDLTTYKAMGKEACQNLTCFKYEVIHPEMEGSQEFILFDDREYKLRKTISISEGMEVESIFSYSSVSISAPTDIKEAGENGENMMNGAGYSEDDINRMMEQYQDSGYENMDTQMDDSTDYSDY